MQDRYAAERDEAIASVPAALRVSEMLVEQIELSDIVVLEGALQASSSQKARGSSPPLRLTAAGRLQRHADVPQSLRPHCAHLAPHVARHAPQTTGSDAYVDTTLLLQTNLHDGEDHAGWHKIMHGAFSVPPVKNVQHFVFNARRPFHPVCVFDAAPRHAHPKAACTSCWPHPMPAHARSAQARPAVVRASTHASSVSVYGLCVARLAPVHVWCLEQQRTLLHPGRHAWLLGAHHAGQEAGGVWYAAVPKSTWPDDPQSLATIKRDFCDDPAIGDRRQEFALIGAGAMHCLHNHSSHR